MPADDDVFALLVKEFENTESKLKTSEGKEIAWSDLKQRNQIWVNLNKEIKFESSNKLYDYNVFTVFCLIIKVTRKYVGI